ncbi:glycerol-3-phosphate 1-O-acyltransferase PlsY [Desulfurivibrio sp. D14AmB]|uniref:glycerol-3-phosphate 1-O-acyltransferase PlsY n=1 Tax=Desulfurivibrio sp. D14AmB TaxID=3374370 RepID=UPI00376ED49C
MNGFFMAEYVVLVAAAYLLGAVPFGLLFGKLAGVDVRRQGSGNIGATNVGRLLGKKLGLLTLAADMLKGVAPMLAAAWWTAGQEGGHYLVIFCGGAAFLGHLFPIWLGFKGGKGVATALGVFLYLAPLAALGALAVFVLVLINWGYVSLASLSAALLMPGLIWLLYHGGASGEEGLAGLWGAAGPETLLALLFAVLIWLKHRDNIERLLRGEEKSWRQAKK